MATQTGARAGSRRDFTLLWTGQAVSELGSRGYGIAIMLWVLAMTGSPAIVGMTATVTMASFALFNVPAGWIVDHADRKRTMVGADLLGAGAATTLAATVSANSFVLAHILTVGAVLGAAWCVRGLAEEAALPHVVGDGELTRAVSLVEGRGYAAGLAGPPLATALYAMAPVLPFAAHAVSFVTAASTASAVKSPLRTASLEDSHVQASLGDGFRFVWRDPFLRPAALIGALSVLVTNGAGLVLIVILTNTGAAVVAVGFALAAAYGAGIGGSLMVPRLQRHHSAHVLLSVSLLAGAIALAMMVMGDPVAATVGYSLLLAAQPLWQVTVSATMLEVTPDELRGRAGGALGLVATVPAVFAPLCAGILAVSLGVATTVSLLTAALLAGFLFTLRARGLRAVPSYLLGRDRSSFSTRP
ncbi:MFS transporter [Hoyosella altamirensis]|uniref:MFS family permease n=1 Tax=Hoyosella altamirensis TaxID=616997 RepID=A0A839RJS4_9ACTN|nr:MFS transporter [Hoyosella altamirensis]MBB3036700.1 MFS family permease [Hoyosella altamirensis]